MIFVIKICLLLSIIKAYLTQIIPKKRILDDPFLIGNLAPAIDYFIDLKFADSTYSYAFIHAKLKTGEERLIVFNYVTQSSVITILSQFLMVLLV